MQQLRSFAVPLVLGFATSACTAPDVREEPVEVATSNLGQCLQFTGTNHAKTARVTACLMDDGSGRVADVRFAIDGLSDDLAFEIEGSGAFPKATFDFWVTCKKEATTCAPRGGRVYDSAIRVRVDIPQPSPPRPPQPVDYDKLLDGTPEVGAHCDVPGTGVSGWMVYKKILHGGLWFYRPHRIQLLNAGGMPFSNAWTAFWWGNTSHGQNLAFGPDGKSSTLFLPQAITGSLDARFEMVLGMNGAPWGGTVRCHIVM